MGSQDIIVANIQRLMAKKGWSINRLADFAGISASYLAALIGGRSSHREGRPHSMSILTLDKLAEALEVRPQDLLVPPRKD